MSEPNHAALTIKCAFCGQVFNVGGASDGALVTADHPVGGGSLPGGSGMGAEGVVIAVVAKGPERQPTEAHESPAYPCPQCGRLN